MGYTHEGTAYYKEDKEKSLKMLHNIIGNKLIFRARTTV